MEILFHFFCGGDESLSQNPMKLICYKTHKIGPSFAFLMITMLSRREVLIVLRTMGVKEPSMLKADLRDYEHYMKKNYGFEISRKRTLRPGDRRSQMMRA